MLSEDETVVSGNAELKVGPDGRTNILIFGTSGYDMQGSEADGIHDRVLHGCGAGNFLIQQDQVEIVSGEFNGNGFGGHCL